MIILLVLAAVVVGAPIAAAILVSLASLREDAKHSLAGRAPGPAAWAARRLLRVQPRGIVLRRAPRLPKGNLLVVNLSGRGDKDIFTVADAMGAKL